MKIQQYTMGPVQTNCYLVINEETKEMVIIDPAVCPQQVLAFIDTNQYQPVGILLTHGHFDHMMGVEGMRKRYPVPVYALEQEAEVLTDAEKNLSRDFMGEDIILENVCFLRDGQTISLAGMDFIVLYTPGHTIGGCCYYLKKEKVLFSGDTLFCGSIGRTDFATGSLSQLVRSIQEKLMDLPEETTVLPGHNEATTIGTEKRQNPYLR